MLKALSQGPKTESLMNSAKLEIYENHSDLQTLGTISVE